METDLPPIPRATDLSSPPASPSLPAPRSLPDAPARRAEPKPRGVEPVGERRGVGLWRWWVRAPVLLAAAVLAVASVAGALGGWHWRLDYFANFPVQYLGLGLLVLLLLLALRSWRVAGGFMVVLLWNTFLVLPLLIGGDDPANGDPNATLRVVQKNVWHGNQAFGDTIGWLKAQDADVIVIQEMSDDWRAQLLGGLTLGGGYAAFAPERGAGERHAVGVFVRTGIKVVSHRYWGRGEPLKPMVEVQLEVAGFDAPVTLQGVHTRAPVRAAWSWLRGRQLAELTGWAAARDARYDGPAVVVGDLNATRWSAPLRALMRHGGLRDTAEGWGLWGTWPDFLNGRWWAAGVSLNWTGMITLDHVLASGHFVVADRTVGPGLGSDHRGVVVDLRRRKQP